MKIINDLADGAVKNNKKDSFAIKISILLAVILLGTVIFVFDSMNTEQYEYVKKAIGDYHVDIAEIDESFYDKLKNDTDIEKVSFNKIINTDLNAVIYENGDYESLLGYEIKNGRKPENSNELLVPERFLIKNKEYDLGSEIIENKKTYTIVGVYDDYGYSFEDTMLIGLADSNKKDYLFDNNAGIEAWIWYKSIRDTYTKTRKILSEMNIDEKQALDIGRVFYNKHILEHSMVYPKGIIPPKSVVNLAIEKYGIAFFLTVLFAFIIYGAFNVWNTRDLKEIALLKSTGMTDKQVKKMIRKKAFKLSTLPIALGTILSLASANLLLYLMWLNNSISYKNMSEIVGESLISPDFHFVCPNPISIIIILLLSLLMVYLSVTIPARKECKNKNNRRLKWYYRKKYKIRKIKNKWTYRKDFSKRLL